jgi:hypothetical protein
MSFFFLLQNQRTGGQNRFCLGGVGTSGREEEMGNEYSANKCMHMYVKMTPVETIPGMEEGGIKYDIFDIL